MKGSEVESENVQLFTNSSNYTRAPRRGTAPGPAGGPSASPGGRKRVPTPTPARLCGAVNLPRRPGNRRRRVLIRPLATNTPANSITRRIIGQDSRPRLFKPARRLEASLQPHQLRDGRSKHHQLLVPVEEELQARQVSVLLVRKLLLAQVLGHDGFHLQGEQELRTADFYSGFTSTSEGL